MCTSSNGPERKVASRGVWSAWGNEISWSPDGKYLVYTDQPENPKSSLTVWLFMLRLDTLDRTVVETGCDTVFTPSSSPRGDYLVWACRETPPRVSVNARRLSDGRTLRLADVAADIQGMAWSGDGRRIIFSAGSGDLLEVSLARPYDPQRLPIGHDASDIAVLSIHKYAKQHQRYHLSARLHGDRQTATQVHQCDETPINAGLRSLGQHPRLRTG